MERFCLKIILEGNFKPGPCKVNPLLKNLGYNNNSTQNQNVLQLNTRNLLGISSGNIEFSNKSIPLAYYRRKNIIIQNCC